MESGNSKKRSCPPYAVKGLEREGLTDPLVLAALTRVPRHRFLPASKADLAYEDQAVSIGRGQTISQPYIVALMTQHARIFPGAKVLEVGTGSGYQSAVLAELGATVYSVEIVEELSKRAAKTLQELSYTDVHTRIADGWYGWPEEAPFDAIVVTAACPRLPLNLVPQLKDGMSMVVPVEERQAENGERLLVLTREGAKYRTEVIGDVRFVPLTGDAREVIH